MSGERRQWYKNEKSGRGRGRHVEGERRRENRGKKEDSG